MKLKKKDIKALSPNQLIKVKGGTGGGGGGLIPTQQAQGSENGPFWVYPD
ncbi:hypothetical protein [Pseudoalteromonas luteoviolacea]|nr:hypothetical protein [Pseudoalteromonas luteoviolacea]MBQ4836811.1 hypothetical protein [Pseudoalteromonas luteoviolacea]